MTAEQMFTLENRYGLSLQGALMRPPGARSCVVLCYPFADERKCVGRHYVAIARQLADHGIASIRFDYSGCGNSGGDFQHATLAQWVSDTVCVFNYAGAAGLVRIQALGLRLGANIAHGAAGQSSLCSHLLMWDPLADLNAYWQSEKRKNRLVSMFAATADTGQSHANDEPFDWVGYQVGRTMIDEMQGHARLDLSALRSDPRVRLGCTIDVSAQCDRPPIADGVLLAETGPFWSNPAIPADQFVSRSVACIAEVAQ